MNSLQIGYERKQRTSGRFSKSVKRLMCLCKEKSHTFIDSANIPALLLKTSILGCALLTSSARLLTCFMEERSAAKLCTFPFPVAFLMLSAAAPALLLFLQKLELLKYLSW